MNLYVRGIEPDAACPGDEVPNDADMEHVAGIA